MFLDVTISINQQYIKLGWQLITGGDNMKLQSYIIASKTVPANVENFLVPENTNGSNSIFSYKPYCLYSKLLNAAKLRAFW